MANIIIGEKVVNKARETGEIVSFDDKYITVEYKNRTAKVQLNAFDLGILKYENLDLQNKVNESIEQAKIEEAHEAERVDVEKVQEERRLVESKTSGMYSQIQYESISLRLDPVSINFNSLEEKELEKLIRDVFKECDNNTREVYDSFNPKMEYPKMTSRSRTRYTVGFLCKYINTYVFRVFTRHDTYKKRVRTGITVLESDTTEIFRILYINGKYYYFTKDIELSYGDYRNTSQFNRWHISYLNIKNILLNEVIRLCDCKYLNDYISEQNTPCYQYTKLLMPALYDNKVEILFKNKQFLSTYYIEDIADYLAPFSSKQIDFACKNNVINALPAIKRCGCYDVEILKHMAGVMGKARWSSTYYLLEDAFKERGFDYSGLHKMLIDFIKKSKDFDAALYHDYIRMLVAYPGLTVGDFFDKNYIQRHDEMHADRWRNVYYSRNVDKKYKSAAKALSWIDREENGYFIIVPKTIFDIRLEGEEQHNCVYKSGYYERVIAKQSIVVFLRKEKDKSYVTIEFDYENFDVLQAYGKFNQKLDPELREYIVELGKRLYAERINLQ